MKLHLEFQMKLNEEGKIVLKNYLLSYNIL
jgi:hypothetical protein